MWLWSNLFQLSLRLLRLTAYIQRRSNQSYNREGLGNCRFQATPVETVDSELHEGFSFVKTETPRGQQAPVRLFAVVICPECLKSTISFSGLALKDGEKSVCLNKLILAPQTEQGLTLVSPRQSCNGKQSQDI